MQLDLMVRELKAVASVWRDLAIGYAKQRDTATDVVEQAFLRGMGSGLVSAADSVTAIVSDYEAGTYTPRVPGFQERLAELVKR